MWPAASIDATALRTHTEILPALTTADDLPIPGGLGYEGESDTVTVAFKKPKDAALNTDKQQPTRPHNGIRSIGERSNS